MRKFWNWVRDPDNERTLYLNGPIAEETWWGDEVTPQMFKDELLSGSGDITVWINSPGGDVFAAAQIYNMLMEYNGQVTVKIDGIAASAASVIAMAGGEVHMSPVSMMMIHNPATIAIGDSVEMVRAKELLDEVKESIINAYELKTELPRLKLARLMDAETWMNQSGGGSYFFPHGGYQLTPEQVSQGRYIRCGNGTPRARSGRGRARDTHPGRHAENNRTAYRHPDRVAI